MFQQKSLELFHEFKIGKRQRIQLTGGNPGESINNDIGGARLVLDCVIIAQEFGKINLLFESLYHLRHEVLEAPVIHKNHERMTQKVVSPLAHYCSYGMKFAGVCR